MSNLAAIQPGTAGPRRAPLVVLLAAAIFASSACAVAGPAVTPASESPTTVEPNATRSPTSPSTGLFGAGPKTLRTIAAAADQPAQLTVGRELPGTVAYRSHAATYPSDGLTISAVLIEPVAPGTHAGVVLVHGFVDPATYTSGGELQREGDALARAGYVVLNVDLRGLAGSDPAPSGPPDLDMGSTDDVINAVRALAAAPLPSLDGTRIGLLGHSLGGLISLDVLVAKPGLVDAVATFAPSGTDIFDNVQRYLAPGDPIHQAIVAAHGTPATNPTYWADVSPRTFVNRVADPLLVVQGDIDVDVPLAGTKATVSLWQQAGKSVEFIVLKGEDHVFEARWHEAMTAVTTFFAKHLRP